MGIMTALAGVVSLAMTLPSEQAVPAAGEGSAVPHCWSIAIHGGSGTIGREESTELRAEYLAALSAALKVGADRLASGGDALEVCEAVVMVLEDDPHFNAGRGAAFTAAGTHELDASIMDGSSLRCGAVAGVRTVRHPVSLARAVMERLDHVLLVGDGAEAFADTTTLERVPNSFFSTERRRRMLDDALRERARKESAAHTGAAGKGTVGCVALDTHGHLAAATSTGGLTAKRYGRVGDSPIIGAGNFASSVCAVSCTGTGEQFIRHSVARMIAARMELLGESSVEAARYLVGQTLNPDDGGVIVVDAQGRVALVYSSEGMNRGAADCHGRFEVGVFEECAGVRTAAAPRAASAPTRTGLNGTLLCIGGGLDEKNEPVLRRFCELASSAAAATVQPRILIATAASGDQDGECLNIVGGIKSFCPGVVIDTMTRELPTDESVRLIDAADGIFFTGGDQKRITQRYRPEGIDTPECAALRRLLARGGVIAGTSAGDAMMGETMFLTGSSAEALGVGSKTGPQVGPGMALQPWVLTDSHFMERHRIGRLIAALSQSGTRIGIGVSENGCVEFDLSQGTARGIGVVPSLLVEGIGSVGDAVTAQLLQQGAVVDLVDRVRAPRRSFAAAPDTPRIAIDPGASRAASKGCERALYDTALANPGTVARLDLDGWWVEAWVDGAGGSGGLCLRVGSFEANQGL